MTFSTWTIAAGVTLALSTTIACNVARAQREVSAPVAVSSGQGVTIRFSDKPVAAPVFSVTTLDGVRITPKDWEGKIVLVNFWATWCGPCREEIPALVALQAHYRDKLLILGLSVDERPAAEVKQFIDEYRLNYPVAIAGDDLQKQFGGITSVPMTFVVNTTGGIVQRHIGLLNAALTEHEVRSLAGWPTEAQVEHVKDTGQVLLANAAYAIEIPGVSLKGLTQKQKDEALRRLNIEPCTCGCNLTLAQCRINDPGCEVSQPAAQKLVKSIAGGS